MLSNWWRFIFTVRGQGFTNTKDTGPVLYQWNQTIGPDPSCQQSDHAYDVSWSLLDMTSVTLQLDNVHKDNLIFNGHLGGVISPLPLMLPTEA